MKLKVVIASLMILFSMSVLSAQTPGPGTGPGHGDPKNQGSDHGPSFQGAPEGRRVAGQRKYKLVVNEGTEETIKEFNRGLQDLRDKQNDRGFLDNLASLYKSSAAGTAISLSQRLLELGVNTLVEATRSKRPDWEKAVRGEASFYRKLPMQMEILDFYAEPSVNGPLDPTGLNFNGFGCRQVIEYVDENGDLKEDEVFYLVCKVKTDPAGKARMLHHSKFEVYVDTLRFNYSICDLPNDSLGMDTSSRIGFSFENREDLKFIVKASITSSWINEAMMITEDQPLGAFEIVASIDPAKIDKDGVFRYYAADDADSGKDVKVTGDCFLVPRSYVGSTDMENNRDSWGTGQYKVEMEIFETCRVKESAYKKNGKWDDTKWKPEWHKIKGRKHSPSPWRQFVDNITSQYKDSQWITVITDPLQTVFLQYETNGLSRLLNTGTLLMTQGDMQMDASAGGQPAGSGGQPAGGSVPASQNSGQTGEMPGAAGGFPPNP